MDELGAGTDPQRGAALAMAILEDLRLRQVKTMATTHLSRTSRPMVSRQPLCKMPAWSLIQQLYARPIALCRVYGRSNAFEIAKRLGSSEVIVGDASQQVDQDNDVNRID